MVRMLSAILLVAACSAPAASAGAGAPPGPSESALVSAMGAHAACRAMLPGLRVTGWERATVKGLRSYQYGGPVAHHPLRRVVRRLPAGESAEWCWVQGAPHSGTLYGVVPNVAVQRAMTVSGPGEASIRGRMHGPPRVP
jgi:hypothetical protein